MMSEDTHNVISSLEADYGPSQPDLLDGLTTGHSGPAPARASRSARPAKGSEPMIQGICGRTFIASSVPAGPLSSWESRLRERLATVGSTESALIWREKTTPAEQSISRLAVSTRHTNGTGSTGSQWSTPRSSDGEKGGPNMSFGAGGQPLPAQMHQSHWGTVRLQSHGNMRENDASRLEDQVFMTAKASPWVTPSARDWKDSAGMAIEATNPDGSKRVRTDVLPRQMVAVDRSAYHPTPQARDGMPPHKPEYIAKHKANGHGMANLNDLLALTGEMEPTGPTPNGSLATTAKRGAPNPVFAFWLMGFPAEWISGALEAMRSYRKPRQK